MESVGRQARRNTSQRHFVGGLGKEWKTSGRGQRSGGICGSTPQSISLAAAQVDP